MTNKLIQVTTAKNMHQKVESKSTVMYKNSSHICEHIIVDDSSIQIQYSTKHCMEDEKIISGNHCSNVVRQNNRK